jgi:hypothetical protein
MMPRRARPASPAPQAARRPATQAIVAILLLATAWRVAIAYTMPVISRDGVGFCWFARGLSQHGITYLRSPDAQQHPLFPLLILAGHQIATSAGIPDGPMTWQRCGQWISILAGVTVVGLAGALTARLFRHRPPPDHAPTTVAAAMLLAALLDRNIWLSADVMSDQTHLALYLAAVCLLLRPDTARVTFAAGLLAGLAFLTREEGLLPLVGGLSAIAACRRTTPTRRLVMRAGALVAGFLIMATPYWITVGSFSSKKDPLDWFEPGDAALHQAEPAPGCMRQVAAADRGPLQQARLKTVDFRWYEVLPFTLYKTFRAGRVVIVLLAIVPLFLLRRALLQPHWIALTTCLAGHFALTLVLPYRYGYLAPRHTLVVVLLLTPFAALSITWILGWTRRQGRAWLGILVALACAAPLVRYAARVPNTKDAFLRDAAGWINEHLVPESTRNLLGGASTRRIAFYADLHWHRWPEDPRDDETLHSQIRALAGGYFAIELAGLDTDVDQDERVGNRALLARLLEHPEMGARLRRIHVQPGPDNSELHLFHLPRQP